MSPSKKPVATSNVYTAILALATGVVLVTAVLVTVKCYVDYETIFKITGISG